ncbi:hypothetical protein LSTR_LSTR006582 [Laodelphax striatellus]|uniref:OCEL domain-containing protein n=1 Tax=Laodelphax striatellus TaxID=195883 RepID=A0A482WS78_LAOST|nr:hypothetical protein LSTR_LSTR006582 [Laodelphax striatellus]
MLCKDKRKPQVDGFQTKRQRISRVVQGGLTASGGSRPMSLQAAVAATRSTPRDEAAMIYNKGGGTGGGGGGYSSKYASSGVTSAVRWTTPSPTPLTNQPQANHNSSHHNQSANSLSPASPTVSSSSSSYSSSSSSFSPSYPPSSSSLHSHHPPPPPPHNDRQPEAAVSTGSSRQQVTTGSSRQQPEVTTGSSRQQPEVVTTGSSDSSRRKADQQQSSSTPMITISASSDHVTGVGSLSVSSLGALSSMTVSSSSSSSTSGAGAASRGGHTNSREYHNEPKYLIDYPRIETLEERRRYKADFNTNYMEYRSLHSRVDKVARKFAALEESLKKEQKDSPAWKSIKNAILEQYQNVKLDKDYQSARQRFGYLHNKLSHIKQRVHEYDTLQCRPPIL